ncbi:hypothetical protein ROTO_16650 [Roseovarius tolerans]|uniref:Phytanoyl-CoA dioxygenase (PhyH) n=1 Tax=Roseovarius tolerans TaxID=74031 RepID=A0A0L6CVW6_9RHOB|nr:hypothetical protein [Roseovarius tolerans]KNX41820.1 hypothetical protein ROTO_16650 [Roseovarius tolerans]
MVEALRDKGWACFAPEPAVRDWAAHAHLVALARIADPQERAEWLQCEGTWFVGVDTLPNDPEGRLDAGEPLTGVAFEAASTLYGGLPLHRGQVSVVYPGYPRPRAGEGEAAFRYRQRRDAAHVDGLLAVGETRRRMLRERHAYILGLPLSEAGPGASPLVVWEGSHHLMRRAFEAALGGVAPQHWGEVDLTEIYQAARREAFETCRRVPLHAPPGGAYLVHRLALHGVAPWEPGAEAPEEGRMVAYFRPQFEDWSDDAWLRLP